VRQAARVLGRLHSPEALPSWATEEPVLSLTDEIDRWDRALATVPADFGLDWAARSDLLRAHLPEPTAPRLTHGDYRLGNLLCQGPLVTAVLDWEIWAVSDGRIDLGWFLLTLDGDLHPAAVRSAEGVPPRSELVAEYLAAGGVPVPDLDWFLALALYKFTATTGLVGKHALRRGDTASWGARMVPRLPEALRRVDELVGR
jgi:aminoglycoside phosphotransferase (APT) family kinase protein